jgi:hypothetical protein
MTNEDHGRFTRILRVMTNEDLVEIIPSKENGEPLSLGSTLHLQNKCSPCILESTPIGCPNSVRCRNCHFLHSEELVRRARKKLGKNNRKLLESMYENDFPENNERSGSEEWNKRKMTMEKMFRAK